MEANADDSAHSAKEASPQPRLPLFVDEADVEVRFHRLCLRHDLVGSDTVVVGCKGIATQDQRPEAMRPLRVDCEFAE